MRLLMTGSDSKRNFDSSESALINALIWNLVHSFQGNYIRYQVKRKLQMFV